jgi:medium-chain acyl-[acyl-carrier-protein] hydrolase
MTSAIWTQRYDVNTMVVNTQKQLGLIGLLNILQDIAWIHGSHLGHGYDAMMTKGWIWVLARQTLVMSDWPAWGDAIDVRTWVRPVNGMLVLRDYEILAGQRKVGEGTAGWLTLDVATRRPIRPAFGDTDVTRRDDDSLALNPARIPVADALQPIADFQVRNSDLDVNGHVNNIRYAQWILDAVPLSAHQAYRIDAYEVNFLAETSVGDRVAIEWDGMNEASPVKALQFQGRREHDGKAVFAARLRISPRTPGNGA